MIQSVGQADILNSGWDLSPGVSLRPEPFGALLYNFGTRRLTFLKTRQLAAVVQHLAASESARESLARADVAVNDEPVYAAALAALADAGMLSRREAPVR